MKGGETILWISSWRPRALCPFCARHWAVDGKYPGSPWLELEVALPGNVLMVRFMFGSGRFWWTRTPNLAAILDGGERELAFGSRSGIFGSVRVQFAFKLQMSKQWVDFYCGSIYYLKKYFTCLPKLPSEHRLPFFQPRTPDISKTVSFGKWKVDQSFESGQNRGLNYEGILWTKFTTYSKLQNFNQWGRVKRSEGEWR